jgi:hypothetical protein
LDRRARKFAQASFVEETDYESIPGPITGPLNKEPINEIPDNVESITEETSLHKPIGHYSRINKRKRVDNILPAPKTNFIDGRLVLLGAAAAGLLIYNYFNKPKITNQTYPPDLKPEKQSFNPSYGLKSQGDLSTIPIKPEETTTQPCKSTTEFKGLPSLELLKLPELGKKQ